MLQIYFFLLIFVSCIIAAAVIYFMGKKSDAPSLSEVKTYIIEEQNKIAEAEKKIDDIMSTVVGKAVEDDIERRRRGTN